MKKFDILSRETLVDEKYCHIEKQIVLTHNKQELEWFVRLNNDAVIIIPGFKTGEFLLQKTYKHGAGGFIVEFPAGMIDTGESAEHAAARELREETGLVAKKIIKLGTILADPTGSPMRYHFFFAENCQPIADLELDDSEQVEPFLLKNLDETEKYLMSLAGCQNKRKSLQVSTSTISGLSFIKNFFQ